MMRCVLGVCGWSSDTLRRTHQRIPESRLTSHDRVSGTHKLQSRRVDDPALIAGGLSSEAVGVLDGGRQRVLASASVDPAHEFLNGDHEEGAFDVLGLDHVHGVAGLDVDVP